VPLELTRRIALVVVVVVLAATGALVAYDLSIGIGTTGTTAKSLPSGCVRPANGFLIIADNTGYNDSIAHGVPANAWPIINVTQGQTVDIVVCNTDTFSHGFQIGRYFDSQIETVGPGQVLHVPPFVASEAGNFQIFCSIPCEVHLYMQSGQLRVSAS